MSQSGFVTAMLLGGFVLYLAIQNKLGTYLSIVGL